MWRSISLRTRLSLIMGSLFALWLVVDAGRGVYEASARAGAETESATRLTTDLVETALAHLQETPRPRRALLSLVESLQNLRHVRVGVGEPSLAPAIAAAADRKSEAPRWFHALVNAPSKVVAIPMGPNGSTAQSIVIVADPSDEIDEAWAGARAHALLGAALGLAALAAMSLLVGRALKPLAVARETLARLESRDYAARAQGGGPPEIRSLNARINTLAGTLGALERQNAELAERVFDAHDQERRVIARELHDEFGPHLFALRASAAALAKKLGADSAGAAARAIESQVEALQGQNRRVLADLRPAALEELGLSDALRGLVAHWRRAEPKVNVTLDVDPRADALDERASLMAYRFVQEAMTNAFRHAGATRIEVSLGFEAHAREAAPDALAGLLIRVADDGRGLQEEHGAGMGLAGMRDRVRMLGGRVAVASPQSGGAVVEARFGRDRVREKIPALPGNIAEEISKN